MTDELGFRDLTAKLVLLRGCLCFNLLGHGRGGSWLERQGESRFISISWPVALQRAAGQLLHVTLNILSPSPPQNRTEQIDHTSFKETYPSHV